MKTILTSFIIFSLAGIPLHAQSLIALQHDGAATFFTDIPAAISAAANGDTIYLPGGSFPGFNIDKKLTIVGTGQNPDSTIATTRTLINGNIILVSQACEGSVFTGLKVNGNIQANNVLCNNIQISRCLINNGAVNCNNSQYWVISECILLYIQNVNNSYISNNLFSHNSSIANASNCQIENNIFLISDGYPPIIGNTCIVSNNIFASFTVWYNGYQIRNSQFHNNIWISGSLPNGEFNDGDIGYGNINAGNFDAIFLNFQSNNYENNLETLNSFDFHLVNPAYNTGGTDGTPIGIYGGTFPWKAGSVPFNPHIQTQQIGGATQSNGNLNVNIRVKAQDH